MTGCLRALAALLLLAAAPAPAAEPAEGTAALQDYANALFLTQLLGAPTAAPAEREPCADILDAAARAVLAEGLSELSTLGTWPLRCAPVGATLSEGPGGLTATLRFLDILDGDGWIETLKRDIAAGRPSLAVREPRRLADLFARLPRRAETRDLDVLVAELAFRPEN